LKHMSRFALLAAALLLWTLNVFPQVTTGALVGEATTDGKPLPGVTVTITSPDLQGTRTTVTGEGGGYRFPAIPPGDYTVTFDLEGMQKVNKKITITLAQTARADAQMRVAAVGETLTVTAAAPAVVETTEVTANFPVEVIRELPVNRDINGITLLAPGVSNGAVNGQVSISGAMSFENLYLVDGVVVNENLRGQPRPLYIEDAIKETTVITGGVSAEYGRFTGGVVSTLTKSGGNDFSGSLRDSLANPKWVEKSAFADELNHIDQVNPIYEGTLGGRLLRDRLWFFGAGRFENRTTGNQLEVTNIPYSSTFKGRRFEGKLTGQITPRHSLVASLTKTQQHETNIITFGPVIDLRSLARRESPKQLIGINYSGILSENLLGEAQFSRMDDDLWRGSETRDLVEGTLLLDSNTGYRMWSPSGCGLPCGVKQHDNKYWLGKMSYFLSTSSTGNHSVAGGYEEFHQMRLDNNFQSGSDFWLHGHIIQDPNDPTKLNWGISPEDGAIEWDPVPNLSKTSDFAMRSLFVNDKWELNKNWSFNVGVRYDKSFGKNQSGVKTVDDSAFSPRLAATFDPGGAGRHRLHATYGRYVAKIDQGPADATAAAGRYNYYYYNYQGPVINGVDTPYNQLMSVQDAIRQVFAWFSSVGGTANTNLLLDVSIPGYTARFDHSLHSPYMDEYTVGYSLALNSRSFLRADLIHRSWGAFYTYRRTLATGKVTDPTGLVVDQGVIENSSSGLSRRYNALQLQGNYQPWQRFGVGGNYTYSKLRGNVEGESPSFATVTTDTDRPEYTAFPQNNPVGFLLPDMRHRANIWARYDLPTSFGAFNFSLLQRYHSGLSYSATGTIDVRKSSALPNGVVNPGYESVPTRVSYTFGGRGAYRLGGISSTDLGLNYSVPVAKTQFFVEADLINIFAQQGIEDPSNLNQTVLTRRQPACVQANGDRCLAFNPLAGDQPVEGVNWQKGPLFGQPTSKDAYQLPRTYRVSLGVRF
jgi:carboxypeptidase family protein/TonB-dependent receptor-like protein